MRRKELPRESSSRAGGRVPVRLAGPAALVLAACVVLGCGGDSGTGIPELPAQFDGSGTESAGDLVRLTGTRLDEETLQVNVVIGPTVNRKLVGFVFDLVLSDGDVATYVDGSATCGDALTLIGTQTCFPVVGQNGDRVAVGIFKQPLAPGSQVRDTEKTVLSLKFVVAPGETRVTFSGSPGNPGDPVTVPTAFEAEVVNDITIRSVATNVSFDSQPATISR